MKLSKEDNDLVKLLSQGYVSVYQLSRLVGISTRGIYNLIKSNKIKSITVGNKIRIYKDEVHRFLREGNNND